MFTKKATTSSQCQSEHQDEWKITMIEVLELDPWKFFHRASPIHSKVHV